MSNISNTSRASSPSFSESGIGELPTIEVTDTSSLRSLSPLPLVSYPDTRRHSSASLSNYSDTSYLSHSTMSEDTQALTDYIETSGRDDEHRGELAEAFLHDILNKLVPEEAEKEVLSSKVGSEEIESEVLPEDFTSVLKATKKYFEPGFRESLVLSFESSESDGFKALIPAIFNSFSESELYLSLSSALRSNSADLVKVLLENTLSRFDDEDLSSLAVIAESGGHNQAFQQLIQSAQSRIIDAIDPEKESYSRQASFNWRSVFDRSSNHADIEMAQACFHLMDSKGAGIDLHQHFLARTQERGQTDLLNYGIETLKSTKQSMKAAQILRGDNLMEVFSGLGKPLCDTPIELCYEIAYHEMNDAASRQIDDILNKFDQLDLNPSIDIDLGHQA